MRLAGPRSAGLRNTGLLAAILVLMALASELGAGTSADLARPVEGPVLPGFAAVRTDITAIRVTLADGSYTLTGTEDGWRLDGPQGFAIRPDRLAQLGDGLQSMEFEARRTADPAKLPALGLADPLAGGNGALIELLTADNTIAASLIAGRKAGRTYVRRPGDNQSFLVTGELPPLHAAEAWLDLDVLDIAPETIAALRLSDRAGRSLYLRRPPGGNDLAFRAAAPFTSETIISPVAVAGPALALSRFRPAGVRPAASLQTKPVARHITETHDDLEIHADIFDEPDGTYLTLRAIEAGQAAQRAAAINLRAAGWAFRLQAADLAEFAPDITTLILSAAQTSPAPALPERFDSKDPAETSFLDDQDTAGIASGQDNIGPPP